MKKYEGFFTILFIVVNGMVNFDVSSHLDNHLQKSLGHHHHWENYIQSLVWGYLISVIIMKVKDEAFD